MADKEKLQLNPDLLTPRDMKRARKMLEGKNPYELMDDPDEAMILTIWCLRSRTDPTFTYDQAENTPFGEFEVPEQGPPENATDSSLGSKRKVAEKSESKPKLSVVEAKSSSENTTDSPKTSTAK